MGDREPAQVIINGDDLGMTPGINRAIKRLHEQGRINSASLMVNMPWSAEAIDFARQSPSLRIGVHLNLSTGHPVMDVQTVPSLVRSDGNFHEISPFLSRFVAGRIKMDEIRTELQAQIEMCLEAGLKPTHVDSHMHFHAFPTLAKVVVELAHQYEISLVRNPDLTAFVVPPMGNQKQVHEAIYAACGRLLGATQSMFSRRANGPERPASHSDQLIYLRWCLRDGDDPATRFQACIDKLDGRTLEIVAHPAEADDILPALSGYVDGRQRELSFLKSDKFLDLMKRNGLSLI